MMTADVDNPTEPPLVAGIAALVDRQPGRHFTAAEFDVVDNYEYLVFLGSGYHMRIVQVDRGWWPPKHRTAQLAQSASERGDSDEAARLLAALLNWDSAP